MASDDSVPAADGVERSAAGAYGEQVSGVDDGDAGRCVHSDVIHGAELMAIWTRKALVIPVDVQYFSFETLLLGQYTKDVVFHDEHLWSDATRTAIRGMISC